MKRTGNLHTMITVVLLLSIPAMMSGQGNPDPITEHQKQETVNSLGTLLSDNYVFPEVAEKMRTTLAANLESGKYDEISGALKFSMALVEDMQAISNDKHLSLIYDPDAVRMMRNAKNDPEDKELEDIIHKKFMQSNYGFEEVRILEGNIGYIRFNRFVDPLIGRSAETAISALQFVSHTEAIIFDLRRNGGGNPRMIQLMMSYFFEEPQHINSFFWRPEESYDQFWTLPYVPGKSLADKDVYILTSDYTFSGAEEFTYNFKHMMRGTVVGEVTGGGAHPVSREIVNDLYVVNLPKGRAINPVTETNWEGVGVKPHHLVDESEALGVAHVLALDSIAGSDDIGQEDKDRAQWWSERVRALHKPAVLEEKTMKEYSGIYGPRNIIYENGSLYYQREGRPKYKMIPVDADTFIFEEIEYFKIRIMKEEDKVVGLMGMYIDGRTDPSMKGKTKS